MRFRDNEGVLREDLLFMVTGDIVNGASPHLSAVTILENLEHMQSAEESLADTEAVLYSEDSSLPHIDWPTLVFAVVITVAFVLLLKFA